MKCDDLENKNYNNGMTAYELMEENGLSHTAKNVKDAIAEIKKKLEDAEMEIRRLNRKYWSDKADEAAKMKRLIYAGEIIYIDEYCNEKDWRIMHKVWKDEEAKCRAKAEEYK